MKHSHPPDQRLAAVLSDEGTVDREAVARLLDRDPFSFTIAEVEAMYVVFFVDQTLAAGLLYTREWAAKLTAVVGGTVTTERIRHHAGERSVRTHSVRRYRGRSDVRRYRAQFVTAPSRARRGRAREHRPAATRRASSSSSTSSADPGDGDPEPAPLHHPRYGRVNANLLTVLESVRS